MTANRLDNNQAGIVKAFENAGCRVQPLNKVKDGCPDILVSVGGVNYLFEIKSSERSKLTEQEQRWILRWRGQVDVIWTAEQGLKIMGLIN